MGQFGKTNGERMDYYTEDEKQAFRRQLRDGAQAASEEASRRYPDKGLSLPVRSFDETQSVFDVLKKEFCSKDSKPEGSG